jgi:SAM-dependent methyltransferase
VLDLGAGTGLLSGVLVAAGHEMVAADPAPEMPEQLTARLPGVAVVAAAAEQLPLAAVSVDVVIAGQAAHWFDPAAAAAEMRRVLRPGGVVGLLWNVRDDRTAWVADLSALMVGEGFDRVYRHVVDAFAAELQADVAVTESGITDRLTPDEVARRMATSSYVATMTSERRAAFLDRVRNLVRTHPDTRGRARVDLPYRTLGYRLTPR